jgi:hypothetical protein
MKREMEKLETAYNSAMDDTDPELVKKAMEIHKSNLTIEEKTEAIWDLFQERRKKDKERRLLKLNAGSPPK